MEGCGLDTLSHRYKHRGARCESNALFVAQKIWVNVLKRTLPFNTTFNTNLFIRYLIIAFSASSAIVDFRVKELNPYNPGLDHVRINNN